MSKISKTAEKKELFAIQLRKLREQKNLTQKELATLMNLTSASISSWEKAKTYPSKEKLEKLSQLLGTTEDYLTGKTDKPLYTKEQVRNKEGILKSIDAKNLGLSPDYRTQIGIIIRGFDSTRRKNLYDLLCASAHFDDNEWKALILVAKAFSQCRIPTLKAYHPLTDFLTLKSFLGKTIATLDKFSQDSLLGVQDSTSPLAIQLTNFEDSLRDDFRKLPNPFKDVKSIKSALAHADTNIESIKRELRKFQIVPAENDKNGEANKRLQEAYIETLTTTYEDDIKDMAAFLGRSDEQDESTNPAL